MPSGSWFLHLLREGRTRMIVRFTSDILQESTVRNAKGYTKLSGPLYLGRTIYGHRSLWDNCCLKIQLNLTFFKHLVFISVNIFSGLALPGTINEQETPSRVQAFLSLVYKRYRQMKTINVKGYKTQRGGHRKDAL